MTKSSDEIISEKREILSFLENRYDIPRERLYDSVNVEKLPDDINDLSFVKRKMIYSSDESVGSLTDEFYSRITYIDDLIRLNFDNPPGFRAGYINQSEIKDDMVHRAKRNPNLVTSSLVSEEQYESLIERLGDQLDFLEREVANCETTEELTNQIRLLLAVMRYCLETGNSANIKNGFRALSYLTSNHNVSLGRHQHAYSKIGGKLEVIFDDMEKIPDNLYSYYGGNMRGLVNCVEKCLNEAED